MRTASVADDDRLPFANLHGPQLQTMNVPPSLYGELEFQLKQTLRIGLGEDVQEAESEKQGRFNELLKSTESNLKKACNVISGSPASLERIAVIPHIVAWDIHAHPADGMYRALSKLPVGVLRRILSSLLRLHHSHSTSTEELEKEDDDSHCDDTGVLLNKITPLAWERVVLYREAPAPNSRGEGGRIMAALPSPPYPPHSSEGVSNLVGPFPFVYFHALPSPQSSSSDNDRLFGAFCSSVVYLREGFAIPSASEIRLTVDPVPTWSCPDDRLRLTKLAAILGRGRAPLAAIELVKEAHAEHVRALHQARQRKLERGDTGQMMNCRENRSRALATLAGASSAQTIRVFTDCNDPMGLRHPFAGLTDPRFELIDDLGQADVIFSFRNVFAPGAFRDYVNRERAAHGRQLMINQFPYEGAFVQKDHLARELQKQHGMPLPPWCIESYDLDVQLSEFIGSAIQAQERRSEGAAVAEETREGSSLCPLWVMKPATMTQSKGHVVTDNLAQVIKILDGGGGSRVAQKYVENPICYDNRKVDCRCIVMMRAATPGSPELYMHNRFYFRIAGREHNVSAPSDLIDDEVVLTAMHLVKEGGEAQLPRLPVDHDTIKKLEDEHGKDGFRWEGLVLPRIKLMIKELFIGMTAAYPAMAESKHSRAVYGIDIMFDRIDVGANEEQRRVEPRLTEVTFCPSNSAICEGYTRDEGLYRSYNNDIFCCLFLGETSENVVRLL